MMILCSRLNINWSKYFLIDQLWWVPSTQPIKSLGELIIYLSSPLFLEGATKATWFLFVFLRGFQERFLKKVFPSACITENIKLFFRKKQKSLEKENRKILSVSSISYFTMCRFHFRFLVFFRFNILVYYVFHSIGYIFCLSLVLLLRRMSSSLIEGNFQSFRVLYVNVMRNLW